MLSVVHTQIIWAVFTVNHCLHRYAITVWYFDADERARAKEKYLTSKKSCISILSIISGVSDTVLHYLVFLCAGAGEKGVKVELGKPSDPS